MVPLPSWRSISVSYGKTLRPINLFSPRKILRKQNRSLASPVSAGFHVGNDRALDRRFLRCRVQIFERPAEHALHGLFVVGLRQRIEIKLRKKAHDIRFARKTIFELWIE